MVASNQNVREGYKMTGLGEIPVEWEVVNFKYVCKVVNGLVDPNIEPYCNYPHIGNANIEKGTGYLLEYKLAHDENLISGKYLFNEQHVLYGKINPHFAKVAYPQFVGLCSADMYPIQSKSDRLQPLYLKYLLLDERFTKQMTSASMRTGIPKVNRKELEMYDFIIPPLKEQQKIAEILSTVDEQIENTEQLIEKTRELKKGLMQQLLTKGIGHTEFKQTELGEIPECWSIYSLGELGEFVKGKGIAKKDITESGHPCILYGQLYTTYSENINTVNFYTDIEIKNPTVGQINDLLIPSSGETAIDIATASALNVDNVYIGGDINLYRPSNKLNSSFLSYQINSVRKSELAKLAQGSSVYHLYAPSLSKFEVVVPPTDEQQKIASILTSVDEQIESYELEKEKYLELKKGLMQQLLTGKIRVTV